MSVREAAARIPPGAVVMVGGFIGVGSPRRFIDELVRQQVGDPTVVCNDTACPGFGIGKLIDAGLVRKVITSQQPAHARADARRNARGQARLAGNARRRFRLGRHPLRLSR